MSDPLGEHILNRVTPAGARSIQDAIASAGGNEVFFAGALDPAGRVDEIRVCARGNISAVPALFNQLNLRDVVIHNHPSGELTPSEADLELAAMYSTHGHGVFIVDNDATRVYVVVEPFTPSQQIPLDYEELEKAFAAGGALTRALPHYEERPQQREMLRAVARAFNEEGIGIVEAPTGVGKTMAYLLPASLWARRNRERIVISTRTINLQEQIVEKDIPLLQQCFRQPFNACLVKGRGNYLCRRKLERSLSEADLFQDNAEKEQLGTIAEWAETSTDGSLSDLPFVPARGLWERVCSEADTCSLARCPDPKKCFVGRARKEMAKADILVTNHHMLFSDLAIKRESGDFSALAVLPAYKRIVFDEAHSIEDSATEYFGISATRQGALATLGRLLRIERERERGLLPLIKVKIIKECPQVSVRDWDEIQRAIDDRVAPMVTLCREQVTQVFEGLREITAKYCGQIGRDIKWRLTPEMLALSELRDFHDAQTVPCVDSLVRLVTLCQALAQRLDDIKPTPDQKESPVATEWQLLTAYAGRLERLATALSEATSAELAENTVRWIEIDASNEHLVRVVRCPLEVGKPLAEWVYQNLRTIVMASATLTVARKFDYLFQRLGLDRTPSERIHTLVLDSPFDFERQALIGIPTDLPAPDEREFAQASVEFIRDALAASGGHAFVLFTAYGALEFAHRALEQDLRNMGITALKQGQASRTSLIERFRADPSSVLFGTDSFWEGVDVAGDALQSVILPRLPFRVPTEPIQQARTEAIEEAGGNAFMEYAVPQAVIKFRQGFGRLIRRGTDRGVVLVLDKRIISKYYGRTFIQSLPNARLVRGPARSVLLALDHFFDHPEGT